MMGVVTRNTVPSIVGLSCLMMLACSRCSPTEVASSGDAGFDAIPFYEADAPTEARADQGAEASDPLAWTAVPGGADCELFVGDVTRLALPPPTWSDCGPGCASLAGPAPGFAQMYKGSSSAGIVGGVMLLRRTMGDGVTGGPSRQQLFRVGDGVTLAVVEQRASGCAVLGAAPAAPSAFTFWHPANGLLAGRAGTTPGSIEFAKTWLKTPTLPVTMFEFSGGLGWGFRDGTVRVLSTLLDTPLTVDSAAGPPFYAAGRGSFVIWPLLLPSGAEIRGWRAGETTRIFVAEKDVITAVAQSDERIAWISTRGPEADIGKYIAAEVRWSPRPATPASVLITNGPALPASYGLGDLQLGGDFAATIGEGEDRSRALLMVVQLSTKKTWILRGRSTDWFTTVFAISADGSEILVGATDAPGTFSGEIRRLFRLRTDRLDDLVKAW